MNLLEIDNLNVKLGDEDRAIFNGLTLAVKPGDVQQQLPMEFMAETQKLIGISLEGSVGWSTPHK